jgi:hypothetical protein
MGLPLAALHHSQRQQAQTRTHRLINGHSAG